MRTGLVGVLVVALGMGCGPATLLAQTGDPPPDRVMAVRGASDFARFQERLTPCVEHARATFAEVRQRFVEGLEPGHDLSVVIRVRDPRAHVEQVFVQVQKIDGPLIFGVISNEVVGVNGFEQGTPVLTFEDEILDWVVVDPNGAETGNFIGKYLDALQDGRVEDPCEPPSGASMPDTAADPGPLAADVTPPRQVSGKQPDFSGLEGEYKLVLCLLLLSIDRDGSVAGVELEQPSDLEPQVRARLIEALESWRFEPATRDGEPAAGEYRVSVRHCPAGRPQR